MIVGIYWDNVNNRSIDLDLSLMTQNGKIGWDDSYRSNNRDILFSGDVTSAPNGASELFYVQKQLKSASVFYVNYYNFNTDTRVPFKVMIGQENISNLEKNYMIDPNNVLAVAETEIDQRQKILGLLVTTTKENRFYFAETGLGKSITATGSDFIEHARKYLFSFYENTIDFKDILEKAGAEIVDNIEDCDINLEPNVLEKDTILNLLK